MDVTRTNFEVVLPAFRQLLATCDFYSMDMEMSGIRFNDQKPPTNPLMTPAEEFAVNFAVAKRYSPIQIGICLFTRVATGCAAPVAEGSAGSKAVARPFKPLAVPDGLPDALASVVKPLPAVVADVRNQLRAAPKYTEALKAAFEKAQGQTLAELRKAIGAATADASAPFLPQFDAFVVDLLGELSAAAGELKRKQDIAGDEVAAAVAAGGTPTAPLSDELGVISGEYEVRPFNFYVFPSEEGDMVLDRQTVSEFLVKHGMDFGKWISSGIPYVTRETASRMRREAALRYINATAAGEGAGPAGFDQSLLGEIASEDLSAVTTLMAEADRIHKGKDPNWTVRVPFLKAQNSFHVLDKYREALGLEFIMKNEKGRKVKYLGLPQSGATAQPAASEGGSGDGDSATTNVLAQLDKTLGATLLFEALVDSRKPIIAHNSFKDFLFLYTAFHKTDLADYLDFKRFLRNHFPLLFDTKTLVNLDAVHDTRIMHLLQREYEYFRDAQAKVGGPGDVLSFRFPLGFEALDPRMLAQPEFAGKAAHDAGFDAWMCGALFLYMRKILSLQGLRVTPFGGSIPLYGLAFNCQVATDEDCVAHDGELLFVKSPGPHMRLDMSRVCSVFAKHRLDGRVGPQYDDRLVFVSRSAKGSGSLLDAALAEARDSLARQFPGATVTPLRFDPGPWSKVMRSATK